MSNTPKPEEIFYNPNDSVVRAVDAIVAKKNAVANMDENVNELEVTEVAKFFRINPDLTDAEQEFFKKFENNLQFQQESLNEKRVRYSQNNSNRPYWIEENSDYNHSRSKFSLRKKVLWYSILLPASPKLYLIGQLTLALREKCDASQALDHALLQLNNTLKDTNITEVHTDFSLLTKAGPAVAEQKSKIAADAIKRVVTDDVIKATALDILEANKFKWSKSQYDFMRWLNELYEENFYSQWASNHFTRKSPYGQTPDIIDDFIDQCKSSYKVIMAKDYNPKIFDELKARLIAHDKPFWQKQEKLAQEQAVYAANIVERTREQELMQQQKLEAEMRTAEQRAAEDEVKRAAFMAIPQPYTLVSGTADILQQLPKTGVKAIKTERLDVIIQQVKDKLDIRDPMMKQLGDILLSASNISALGKALTIQDTKLKPDATLRGRLQELYAISDNVRAVVDSLVIDDETLLVLASLTRSPQRTHDYALFIEKSTKEMAPYVQELASMQDFIREFPEEERSTLEAGPEIKDCHSKIKAERERLDIDRQKSALAKEVTAIIQGKNPKHILESQIALAETAEDKEITIRDNWCGAMNSDYHARHSPEGEKWVRIASNAYSDKYFDIKKEAGNETFIQRLTHLRDECAAISENNRLLEELINVHHCALSYANNQTILEKPAFNLKTVLPRDELENKQELLRVKQHMEEKLQAREQLLYEVAKAGIEITITPEKSITIKHHRFGAISTNGTINFGSELSEQDCARMQNLVKLAHPKPLAATQMPEWQPKADETLIIFDTSSLQYLEAPRSGGRTWLDIVKATAKLSNLKILIPAVVAEWEMQGRIPLHDANGHIDAKQGDKRFSYTGHALHKIAAPMQEFLKSAAQARLDENDVLHMLPHTDANVTVNNNVIVVHTPEDEKLYQKISLIVNAPGLTDAEKHARLTDEVYKRGEGEAAIGRIVTHFPVAAPMVIISEDLKHFRHGVQTTTGKGMPVARCCLKNYLAAELDARWPNLQTILQETSMPHNKDVAFLMIHDQLVEHYNRQAFNKMDKLLDYDAPGHHGAQSTCTGPGKKIGEIIKEAIRAKTGVTYPAPATSWVMNPKLFNNGVEDGYVPRSR